MLARLPPRSKAGLALTPFSRTRYYASSACNRPSFYTLREHDRRGRPLRRSESALPARLPADARPRKLGGRDPVIEVQHITLLAGYGSLTDGFAAR